MSTLSEGHSIPVIDSRRFRLRSRRWRNSCQLLVTAVRIAVIGAPAYISCCHLLTLYFPLNKRLNQKKSSSHFVFCRMLFWNCVTSCILSLIFVWRCSYFLLCVRGKRRYSTTEHTKCFFKYVFFPEGDNNNNDGPNRTVPTLKKGRWRRWEGKNIVVGNCNKSLKGKKRRINITPSLHESTQTRNRVVKKRLRKKSSHFQFFLS